MTNNQHLNRHLKCVNGERVRHRVLQRLFTCLKYISRTVKLFVVVNTWFVIIRLWWIIWGRRLVSPLSNTSAAWTTCRSTEVAPNLFENDVNSTSKCLMTSGKLRTTSTQLRDFRKQQNTNETDRLFYSY